MDAVTDAELEEIEKLVWPRQSASSPYPLRPDPAVVKLLAAYKELRERVSVAIIDRQAQQLEAHHKGSANCSSCSAIAARYV